MAGDGFLLLIKYLRTLAGEHVRQRSSAFQSSGAEEGARPQGKH